MKKVKTSIHIISDGDDIAVEATGQARDIANDILNVLIGLVDDGNLPPVVVKYALLSAFFRLEEAG